VQSRGAPPYANPFRFSEHIALALVTAWSSWLRRRVVSTTAVLGGVRLLALPSTIGIGSPFRALSCIFNFFNL
jgi:hypothetical protein